MVTTGLDAKAETLLAEMTGRLRDALGGDLVCLTLHGSAASGDYEPGRSDLNLAAVLAEAGPEQIQRAHAPVVWWMKRGQPAPTLLAREELRDGADAFAIEFADMRNAYRLLHGEDVLAGLRVDPLHLRHQVEHELRAGLLRLRERYLILHHDPEALLVLMRDSLPSFATLLRHAAMLGGGVARMTKRGAIEEAAKVVGVRAEPFEAALALRTGGRRPRGAEVRPLFESYLAEVARAARFVDGSVSETTRCEKP